MHTIWLWLGSMVVLGLLGGLRRRAGQATRRPTPPALGETTSPLASTIDTTQDPQATGYPDSRKLVRDRAGNLYAAYRKKGKDQAYHIFVATLPSGERQWRNQMQIEQVGAFNQRVPALAIDQHDTVHVVWYGLHGASQGKNDRQIYYSCGRPAPGGHLVWDTPIMPGGLVSNYGAVQPEPTLWQEHPAIHITTDGQIYIVWEGKDHNHAKKAQIKLTRSLDGGSTWTPWRNLPGAPDTYYSRPTLVAGGNGQTRYCLAYATGPNRQTRLVWTQTLPADNTLAEDWQPWREVTPIDDAAADCTQQDQRHVSLVIDAADQLHVAWQQKSPGSMDGAQIGYACFAAGKWSAPSYPVAKPSAFQTFPSITVDQTGRLWLAWNEFPQEPDFQAEEPVAGCVRIACKPPAGDWQLLDATRLLATNQALYPSLRRQRFPDHAAVDLLWLAVSQANSSDQQKTVEAQAKPLSRRYLIVHANLSEIAPFVSAASQSE